MPNSPFQLVAMIVFALTAGGLFAFYERNQNRRKRIKAERQSKPIAWTETELHELLNLVAVMRGKVGNVPASLFWRAFILVAWDLTPSIDGLLKLRSDDWQRLNLSPLARGAIEAIGANDRELIFGLADPQRIESDWRALLKSTERKNGRTD